MKKILLVVPFLFACGGAEKAADGEACTSNDDCASAHCHIEADAEEGVCEAEEGHDEEGEEGGEEGGEEAAE